LAGDVVKTEEGKGMFKLIGDLTTKEAKPEAIKSQFPVYEPFSLSKSSFGG
jgi:hypothetical protein